MRLVLANVEPLAEIIGRAPRPIFIDCHQPCVITLLKLPLLIRNVRDEGGVEWTVLPHPPVCPNLRSNPRLSRGLTASRETSMFHT
jgi:hypothetical protein